jgi:citrate lyase subunit beta/citryl-CoA lyase/(S)-citramalyl-CoA lyase
VSAPLDEARPRRCVLFVPGSRPERHAKALASGADQVAIDLEDAVGPGDKDIARDAALAFLAALPPDAPGGECGLRINPPSTADGARDLQALAESSAEPAFVMVPKAESVADVEVVDAALGERRTRIVPLVESPRGLLAAKAIATASARVSALMFGGYDYAVALRGRPGWESFLAPRSQLGIVAAATGIGFIDVPFLGIDDAEGLAGETDRVIALGATAKAAIHPAQVATIQARFLPTAAELAWARRVLAAIEGRAGEAVAVDGKLVDRPIELAARRALALGALGVRD